MCERATPMSLSPMARALGVPHMAVRRALAASKTVGARVTRMV